MREEWIRGDAALAPDHASVEHVLRRLFQNASLVAIEPTSGGLANTNLKVSFLDGSGKRIVTLRYWQRDCGQARKEIALLRLVKPRVPAPKVLAFGDADPRYGLPYAILEWIEGERFDLAAPRLQEESLRALGRSVGAALAGIHSFTFDRHGFFGESLDVAVPIDLGRDGVLHWIRKCLLQERGGDRLGAELAADFLGFFERKGHLLDGAWARRTCLTHADFNGSNILVRPAEDGSSWNVVAILDWEFAFAGGPAFDFGNLLRPPFGLMPGYVDGVAAGYVAAGGDLADGWQAASLIADLVSWADSINRENATASVIEEARKTIRRVIDADARLRA